MTTSGTGCAQLPSGSGTLPRLLRQSEYNARLWAAGLLMEAALRCLASHTPASAELVRLLDATPVPCGQSAVTARRSDLYGWAGYGYCPSHSRWYWGSKLMLIWHLRGDGDRVGLANPNRLASATRPGRCSQPSPPTARHRAPLIVTDKGLAGEGTEEFFASPGLDLTLIRPARKDEPPRDSRKPALRQRIEAIIWTLKEPARPRTPRRPGPACVWARTIQRARSPSTPSSGSTGKSAHRSSAP